MAIMAVTAVVPFLVAMMLVTGVCNTLLTKYQDMQCVRNCDSTDRTQRAYFEQPVIQTAQMFIGEMGCWLVVLGFGLYNRFYSRSAPLFSYTPVADDTAATDDEAEERETDADLESLRETRRHRRRTSQELAPPALKPLTPNDDLRRPLLGWNVVLLALPACCDIAGTTLMNVGLLFVAASIYQMTRGALVLFVGLFSVLFLRRYLHLYQWFSLLIVVLGVALVGLAGAIFKDHKATPSSNLASLSLVIQTATSTIRTTVSSPTALRTVVGVFLIAGAQIFTATQFVLEEWILEQFALEPLKVVGWEGIFGFLVTVTGMIVLHLSVGRTEAGRYGYFDAVEGWRQVSSYRTIWITSLLIMLSIGGFNFFGLSVTRTVSATSRSTIDTCRTLFIWMVSLSLGWETFKWLQVLGFVLLVYGTFLFNDIVRPPLRACWTESMKQAERDRDASSERLLEEEPIEHI